MVCTQEVGSKSSSFMNALDNALDHEWEKPIREAKKKKDGEKINVANVEIQSKGGRL